MTNREAIADQVLAAGKKLRLALNKLDFSSVATWVYNPFDYAWDAYAEYVTRFVSAEVDFLYMGMNPGPWGMVQTGVPFGEVAAVRDWLQIKSQAKQPKKIHPKRPIEGLACNRSEVSGKRLWGLFAERYQTPNQFFAKNFIINYCPLAFMDDGARNLTPDKFPTAVRESLEKHCDRHLVEMIRLLKPRYFIGVGGFAEQCAQRCIDHQLIEPTFSLVRILHPSPASPAANRDWSGQVQKTLYAAGIWS